MRGLGAHQHGAASRLGRHIEHPRARRRWQPQRAEAVARLLPWRCGRGGCVLAANGLFQAAARPQAEMLLLSTVSKFPGPNTRQRKGSSICALPNTRRCKPRWQLPLCSTFSLFFSRCREPSLVSDAECVFAVYVQEDWSYYFGAGKELEEQSFVLIANLNKLIF